MRFDPEPVARVCYAALRQLREEQGCRRGPVWSLLVAPERDWYVRAAARAASGWLPEEIQAEWRRELELEGWKPGPDIDHVKRTHPEMAGWEDLGEDLRRRYLVIQMVTTGCCLALPPAAETAVTAM